ncbi:MAG: hypothetical protein WCY19_05045 [Candidatus Gastranaerophilaceae bacterium]
MTTQEQLNQINSAITAIETGAQEYSINNRKFRRPDLSILYAERKRIENIRDNNDGIYYTRFDGR